MNLNNTQAGLVRFSVGRRHDRYAPAHIEHPDEPRTLCGVRLEGGPLFTRTRSFRQVRDCQKCSAAAERVFGQRPAKSDLLDLVHRTAALRRANPTSYDRCRCGHQRGKHGRYGGACARETWNGTRFVLCRCEAFAARAR